MFELSEITFESYKKIRKYIQRPKKGLVHISVLTVQGVSNLTESSLVSENLQGVTHTFCF